MIWYRYISMSVRLIFLINMNYVQSITPNEFVMSDGSTIPISKKDSKTVNDIYTHFKEG